MSHQHRALGRTDKAVAAPVRMAPSRLAASSASRLAQVETTGPSKQADSFYLSKQWKSFRNLLIKERGWRCEDPKCETPRGPWKQIYGDHIIEIADGGAKLDRRNVLLRCGVCHGRKTRDEKLKRAGWIDVITQGGGGSKV
jgi:5-methylcytosine-specific restriction protein A